MSRSHTGLAVVAGGVVILLVLGFVTLTGMSASLAWSQSGGYRSGPGICQTATAVTSSPTPGAHGATPSPTGTEPACVPASKIGAQVVALAKSHGRRALRQPGLRGTHQLSGLLRHLVQGTRQRLPTRRACLPAGGNPVRRAGVSRLLGLGQRQLPVRELRAWSLLSGVSHAADGQRLRPVGDLRRAARLAGGSLGSRPARAARHADTGRRDDLQGCEHRARGDCDECGAADLHHGRRDHLQQLE